MFVPGGCSGRQSGCPFLRGRRSLLRGGFLWYAAMVSEAGAFLLGGGLQHHFQENDKGFSMPYVVGADRYFPEARKTIGLGGGTRLAVKTARGERMVRNSKERGAWWQVRSGVEDPLHISAGVNTALPVSKTWYYAGLKVAR